MGKMFKKNILLPLKKKAQRGKNVASIQGKKDELNSIHFWGKKFARKGNILYFHI